MIEQLINAADNIMCITTVFASLWILQFSSGLSCTCWAHFITEKKDDSFESILRAELDSFSSNHPVLDRTCKLALCVPICVALSIYAEVSSVEGCCQLICKNTEQQWPIWKSIIKIVRYFGSDQGFFHAVLQKSSLPCMAYCWQVTSGCAGFLRSPLQIRLHPLYYCSF